MTFQVLIGWLVGHIQYDFDHHKSPIVQLGRASSSYLEGQEFDSCWEDSEFFSE